MFSYLLQFTNISVVDIINDCYHDYYY